MSPETAEDSPATAPFLNAAVARAGHATFRAGTETRWSTVGSRCLLWGIGGRGLVRSGDRTFELTPGAVILLPWGHDITYRGLPDGPFGTGFAHLLPWSDPSRPIFRDVAHDPGDPLWKQPDRADLAWPGFETARAISGGTAVRLVRLGECAAESVIDHTTDDAVLRSLGLLIAATLLGPATRPDLDVQMPATLRAMQQHVLTSMGMPLDADVLAAVAGCSRSTAERQFRRYTGRSVQEWIRDVRLDRASQLLRVSTYRVSEVGRAVGFTDPLHFSRVFRRRFGASPTRFRSAAVA